MMKKKRFFASLKYARDTQFMTQRKSIRELLFSLFQYAYTIGWNDRANGRVIFYK